MRDFTENTTRGNKNLVSLLENLCEEESHSFTKNQLTVAIPAMDGCSTVKVSHATARVRRFGDGSYEVSV